MRTLTLAALAAAALGSTALPAVAQIYTRVRPLPPVFEPEEVRDYSMDQLERRQEIEREALRFRQRAERRVVDPDDDDDDVD